MSGHDTQKADSVEAIRKTARNNPNGFFFYK